MEMGQDGRVGAVIYRRASGVYRVRARAIVLAMGAVETPRLLLASRSAGQPNGVANGSGLVGRYLLETMCIGGGQGLAALYERV